MLTACLRAARSCACLLHQVTGLTANEGVAQMAFSPKNRGRSVRHVIERAVSNADFYHGWSRDELVIQEAVVGKNAQYPRIRYHARGATRTPSSSHPVLLHAAAIHVTLAALGLTSVARVWWCLVVQAARASRTTGRRS